MDQNNLVEFRKWLKKSQEDRESETDRLMDLLDDIEKELDEWDDDLEERDGVLWYRSTAGETPSPHDREIRRHYQGLWKWKWEIDRQLRELIRAERSDLEWLDKLERRKRAKERVRGNPIGQLNNGPEAEPNEEARQIETRKKPGSKKNRQHKKTSHPSKLT